MRLPFPVLALFTATYAYLLFVALHNTIEWWDTLTHQDITIFSDGSEQRTDGERFVTYGYAIY
jgi:hypothetical protein